MSAADAIRAERTAQGLPERLEDPSAVDRVLAILVAGPAGRSLTARTAGKVAADA